MDNATRKDLLYKARAAGYPGSILDVFAGYEQGKDLVAEFQQQQQLQQLQQQQMPAQSMQPQQQMQAPQMPVVPSSPTPAPNFTPPQPAPPIGIQSQQTQMGLVSGQSGPNQGRAIFKTGGFKYEEGGPIKGFDLSKSMAENLELNRRARAAGWNSVEEYEKAGWGYNTVKQKQQELINNPQVQQMAKTAAELHPELANVQARQDQLSANRTSGAQKAINQAYHVLSNPVEAAGHAMKYGYVPQGNLGNYGHRGDGDAFATTINDFVNPFAWGNAAYRFSKDVTNKDSYTTGMGALNMGADFAESLPFFGAAAKTMTPAVKSFAAHPKINIPKSPQSINSNSLSKNLLLEVKDIFNTKGKEQGVNWLKSWYNDPETVKKIKELKQYDNINSQSEAAKYSEAVYPNKKWDVEDVNRLTIPKSSFFTKSFSNYDKIIPHTYDANGKFLRKIGDTEGGKLVPKKTVTIHEGTHQLTHNGGFFNKHTEDLLQQGFKKSKDETLPEWTGKIDASYYTNPTEIHARVNEIRHALNLKPTDVVTEDMFKNILNTGAGLELKPYIKNKKLFIETMNKLPVALPIGVGAYLKNKEQKKLGGAKCYTCVGRKRRV